MTTALAELALPMFSAPALCVEVDTGDLFYPEKGSSTRDAKAICRRCEAVDDCLDYALEHKLYNWWDGVWGGTSPRERKALLAERAPVADTPAATVTECLPLTLVPSSPRDPRPARPPRRMRPWTRAELAAAVRQLAAAGMRTAEIAEALEVTPARVRAARGGAA